MHIVVPPLLPAVQKNARDWLVELSQTRSLKRAVDDIVEDLIDYATETDPYLKRRKWCLATIYSRAELDAHVEYHLRNSGVTFAATPEFIAGEQTDTEVYPASIFDAWFGIGFGFGSIHAENVDWRDAVYDYSFATEKAMEDYLDAHFGSETRSMGLVSR